MVNFNVFQLSLFQLQSRLWMLAGVFFLSISLLHGQSISGDTCISVNASSKTYTFSPSNQYTNVSWSVKGDLAIVSTGSKQVTVESVANHVDPSKAYGKGRIIATYTDTALSQDCGPQQIHLDVCKEFDDHYPIIGPECVNEGDTVTYSVNSIVSVNLGDEIGIDRYDWKFPSNWSLEYYSSDSSSITLKADSVTGNDTLIVGIGKCNFTNGVYTDTLVVGRGAPEPDLSYPACVSADSNTVIVQNLNVGSNVNYEWNFPSNWNEVSSSASQITLDIDENPGTVTLTATTPCDSIVKEAEINRSLGANDTIDGPTCVDANTTHTYTVDAPINTPLDWDIPSGNGWSFASSNTASQSVDITVGDSSGTITVSAKECPSKDTSIFVEIKPGDPSNLTGDTCLTAGSTDSLTYSIQAASYADQYKWIFPSGWSPSPQTTSATSVTVQPDGSTSGQVKVFALGCENSDTLSLDVDYGAIQPNDIVASTCINSGIEDTVTFSVGSPVNNQSYNWITPSGWNIVSSNSNNSSVDIETNGIDGQYTLQVRGENACANSAYYSENFNISAINAVLDSIVGFGNIQYAVLDDYMSNGGQQLPSGTTYQWFFDGNKLSGETNYSITLDSMANTSNQLEVNVSLPNDNCKTRLSTGTLYYYNSRMANPDNRVTQSAGASGSGQNIRLIPNPVQNTFRIEINEDFERASMKMKNLNGQQIKTIEDLSDGEAISVRDVSGGMYLLKIMVDDKVYIKKLQIQD